MIRRLLRKLRVGAYVLFISLVALEAAARLSGYAEPHMYDPIYTLFEQLDDIPYVHKPDLREARARGLAIINTDSLGLRTKRAGTSYHPKQPGEYRIAIAGDSCTFGEGVPRTEDTFPQVLEDSLNHRQQFLRIKVFNFGTSAYSVKEMAATLQHRMLEIEPDLVMLAMVPQDLNLSRTPMVDSAGYLLDRKLSFLKDSVLLGIARRIHLFYIVKDLALHWAPPSQDHLRPLSERVIPESYRYLSRFKETAERRKLSYLVVLVPMGPQAWGMLPSRLTDDSIRFLDLAHLNGEFTREQYMAGRFDPHPSAAVHRRIGESLADYVLNVEWKKDGSASSVRMNVQSIEADDA